MRQIHNEPPFRFISLTTYTTEYSIVFQSFFFMAWFFFIQLAFDKAGLHEQSRVFRQILKRVFDNERMEEKTNPFSKKNGFNIKIIERSLRIIRSSLNIPAFIKLNGNVKRISSREIFALVFIVLPFYSVSIKLLLFLFF